MLIYRIRNVITILDDECYGETKIGLYYHKTTHNSNVGKNSLPGLTASIQDVYIYANQMEK